MARTNRQPATSLIAGRWWKASAYEIRKNRIVPKMRATLAPYDPWAPTGELAPLGAKRSERRPYTSLVDLVDSFVYARGSDGAASGLDDASRNAICAWCREHGLLGVLLQLVHDVVLRDERGQLTRFTRSGDRWLRTPIRNRLVRGVHRRDSPGVVARPVYEAVDEPYASIQRLDEEARHVESLGETWSRFFTGAVRDAAVFPEPQSRGFWRVYGEPLDEFIEAAVFLRDAIHGVGDREEHRPPKAQRRRSLSAINRLTSGLSTEVEIGADERVTHRWSSPSLIATYAQMVKEDVVSRRIAFCSGCGRAFVTRSPWAHFCSDTCAHRVRKRRQRARYGKPSPDDKTVD